MNKSWRTNGMHRGGRINNRRFSLSNMFRYFYRTVFRDVSHTLIKSSATPQRTPNHSAATWWDVVLHFDAFVRAYLVKFITTIFFLKKKTEILNSPDLLFGTLPSLCYVWDTTAAHNLWHMNITWVILAWMRATTDYYIQAIYP